VGRSGVGRFKKVGLAVSCCCVRRTFCRACRRCGEAARGGAEGVQRGCSGGAEGVQRVRGCEGRPGEVPGRVRRRVPGRLHAGRAARLDVALLRHGLLDDLALLAGLLAANSGGGRSEAAGDLAGDLAEDLAASRGRRPVAHPRHRAEAHRGTPRHTEAYRGTPRHTPQAAAEPRRGGGGPWGSARAQHAQSATPWGAWERLGHWGCCAHTAAAGPRRAATGPRRVVAGPGPGRGRARPGRAELGPRCAPAGVRRSAALLLAPRSAATSARLATGEG
jgi:hypothetical protein